MLQITNLSKSYGGQTLFDEATFAVNPGERIGLVGRNGHGKSTLLRLITGEEEADSGTIHCPPDYRVGYLTQHLQFTEKTILEEASRLLPVYDNSWKEEHRAESILFGLGFSPQQLELSPLAVSGGFQVRLHLARLLTSEPQLLLLDEPTNYLDIISLRWLLNFLTKWPHELVLITHDHDFMNKACTHTVGIHRAKIRKLQASTHKFFEQIALEEEIHEQSRLNQEKKIRQQEVFIDTFRAKASKAKAVQSRVKALEKMQTMEKLDDIKSLRFSFNSAPCPSKIILSVNSLAFNYPESELLFKDLEFAVGREDRIAVIGKNGRGKSTLLKVLTNELRPTTGEINGSPHLQLGYFGQTNVDRLHSQSTVEEELLSVTEQGNRTLARTVAGIMMFEGDSALKQISVLSGGEKSRVLLGKIILAKTNLLVLDEPTNHLDMYSAEALLGALEDFPGALLIVSHSEHLIRKLANRLIVFDNDTASIFEGDYDQFLRQVGWSDEGGVTTSSKGPQLSKKERRKQRGELVQQKSQSLKPLQKKVETLETKITSLEEETAKLADELIEATKFGFGDDGAKLSRVIHQNRESIESLYSELTTATEELERQVAHFDGLLAGLGE